VAVHDEARDLLMADEPPVALANGTVYSEDDDENWDPEEVAVTADNEVEEGERGTVGFRPEYQRGSDG
jgi:hypothetical protein